MIPTLRPMLGGRLLNPNFGPNRGMVQRFVSFRGQVGGKTWYNQASAGTFLTLTDLAATEGWFGNHTPAGNPSMRLQDSGSPWSQLVYTGAAATSSTWTMAVWLRPLSGHPTGNSRQDVITKHGATPALQLQGDASGGVKMRAFLPAAINSTTVLPLGPWYRMVFTGDGTNVRFYVNGGLTDTNSNTSPISQFTVAGQYTGAQGNALWADIDDICFSTRTWSAADVYADYLDGLEGYRRAFLPESIPLSSFGVAAAESSDADEENKNVTVTSETRERAATSAAYVLLAQAGDVVELQVKAGASGSNTKAMLYFKASLPSAATTGYMLQSEEQARLVYTLSGVNLYGRAIGSDVTFVLNGTLAALP